MTESEILARKIRAIMEKFDLDYQFSVDVRYIPNLGYSSELRSASVQLVMKGYENTIFMGSTDESIINQLKGVFQREQRFYILSFTVAYYFQLLFTPFCYILFVFGDFTSHWEALAVMGFTLFHVGCTICNFFTLQDMTI